MSGDKHWDVKMHEYNRPESVPSHDELVKRHGKVHPTERTGSVIVAAIKTANMTTTEMGQILNAITGRICAASEDHPELEEMSCDLSAACEFYEAAMRKIDERRASISPADAAYDDWLARHDEP